MLAVVLAALLTGCTGGSAAPAPEWTTGFWFWYGSSARVKASVPADVLYVQAGYMRRDSFRPDSERISIHGGLSGSLPSARSYWLVFRVDSRGLPRMDLIPALAEAVGKSLGEARKRGMSVAGVQLDVDSPTGRLREYSAFLREFRKTLPAGVELSITALLDWFRSGTAIADVVAEVDEFVPQFYDVDEPDNRDRVDPIGVPVEAARFGPAFERFGKRYRIGLSSFGRARLVRASKTAGLGASVSEVPDLNQLDLAQNRAFQMSSSHTRARQVVVRYESATRVRIGWSHYGPGDTFEFVLPTTEFIRAGAEAARSLGSRCAGVLFFRWPAEDESLTAYPDQVLRAAGVQAAAPPRPSLLSVDRKCAAVYCADLYLISPEPNEQPVRHRIKSSAGLEYFLPQERTPAFMAGPYEVEVALPAFCVRPKMHLGRVVASAKSEFRLEVAK